MSLNSNFEKGLLYTVTEILKKQKMEKNKRISHSCARIFTTLGGPFVPVWVPVGSVFNCAEGGLCWLCSRLYPPLSTGAKKWSMDWRGAKRGSDFCWLKVFQDVFKRQFKKWKWCKAGENRDLSHSLAHYTWRGQVGWLDGGYSGPNRSYNWNTEGGRGGN